VFTVRSAHPHIVLCLAAAPLLTPYTTAAPVSDKPTYAAALPRLRQNVADITAAQSQRRGNHIVQAQVDIIRI